VVHATASRASATCSDVVDAVRRDSARAAARAAQRRLLRARDAVRLGGLAEQWRGLLELPL
jgi:hypothetical protein